MKTLNYIKYGINKIYSLSIIPKFKSFGKGSNIYYPSKIINPKNIIIGNGVEILEHCWLNTKERDDRKPTLIIGDGTYIGRFCQINAWHEVVIESNVLIGDRVFISDADHIFSNIKAPIINQGDEFKGPVHLSSGCWLGIGSVILPGVKIGKNAVVGANCVVTKDVPENTVVCGVPAKTIKTLSDNEC